MQWDLTVLSVIFLTGACLLGCKVTCLFLSFRPKKEVKEQRQKKPRKGKGKGQKRKRKKNHDLKNREAQCEPCCDGCSERRKQGFIQDPLTCQCSCRNSNAHCRARYLELNERTCRCDKPRR
ncbi:unnamed protein product [Oncorhynchus mykiss]|uniref:Vascular endothelial growth factor heparin-binding domain-containing protein n=1 Tax=Oncorhynchus mykiss TaxID=8022 RepID=A0A060VPG1_ONCMY|nr:unnamed protein product [Oncorhynchus mykiss]